MKKTSIYPAYGHLKGAVISRFLDKSHNENALRKLAIIWGNNKYVHQRLPIKDHQHGRWCLTTDHPAHGNNYVHTHSNSSHLDLVNWVTT